jgi:sterol desaturase/sphingolipid hydroxylase (fatty acid hydroxylase superfamily)
MINVVRDTHTLLRSSGELQPGRGVTTVIALGLGALSLLGVLVFHYPQYLTTPDLRPKYPVELLRFVLLGALLVAGTLSLFNLVRNRRRNLNALALGLVTAAAAWGGAGVPVGNFSKHTPFVGLDWFVVDLLLSGLIFVLIEKGVPLDKTKAVFRRAWQTDLAHFAMTHFLVGVSVVVVNFLMFDVLGWLQNDTVHVFVRGIPFVPQLILCILVADLAEYWTHRAYHEMPLLWKFHAVHHSTETLDWLAGSRLHIFEMVTTRVFVLTPLYLLGFSQGVLNIYIVIIGFWGVLIHANVRLPWGPLRSVLVTPDFHHWHHSSDDEAIDKNYATQFAFLDRLFGTAVKSDQLFPQNYGVVGNYMPEGFVRQQLFPFQRLLAARAS